MEEAVYDGLRRMEKIGRNKKTMKKIILKRFEEKNKIK